MSESTQAGAKAITDLGKILGAMMGLCIAIGFFGEPFLDDYVESHIEEYEEKHKEELSSKVKLRSLLASKMGCDQDEVHIEIGKMYREEKTVHAEIDSVDASIKKEVGNIKFLLDQDYNWNKSERRKILREIQIIKEKLRLD